MLASTVKFSKYDRSRTQIHAYPTKVERFAGVCGPRGPARNNVLIPQDPTVCLSCPTDPTEVPRSHEQY